LGNRMGLRNHEKARNNRLSLLRMWCWSYGMVRTTSVCSQEANDEYKKEHGRDDGRGA